MPLAQALNATTHTTDAKAFIALARPAAVGRQEEEDRHERLLHGRPDRVAHRGGGAGSRRRRRHVPRRRLVTKNPDSPHLLIPKMKAQFLIAIAENDDMRDPKTRTC